MDENPYKSPHLAGSRRVWLSWRIILAAAALLVLIAGLLLPFFRTVQQPVYRRWPAGLNLDDVRPAAERPADPQPSP